MTRLILFAAILCAAPGATTPGADCRRHDGDRRRAPVTITRLAPDYNPRSQYRFFGYYGPADAVTLGSVLFPGRPPRGVILEGSQ